MKNTTDLQLIEQLNIIVKLLQAMLNESKKPEKVPVQQKEILTFDEFCEYLSISKSFGYKLTQRKEVPFYRPTGKLMFFERKEVDKWLMQHRVKTKAEIETEAANYSLNTKQGRG